MTAHGVAAAEAAELEDLRRRAEQRRREVGDTIQALAERVGRTTDPRAVARQALRGARRQLRAFRRAATRRPGLAAVVAGAPAAAIAATAIVLWAARSRRRALGGPSKPAPGPARRGDGRRRRRRA